MIEMENGGVGQGLESWWVWKRSRCGYESAT